MCCQTAAQAYLCGEERKVELKECEMWAVLSFFFCKADKESPQATVAHQKNPTSLSNRHTIVLSQWLGAAGGQYSLGQTGDFRAQQLGRTVSQFCFLQLEIREAHFQDCHTWFSIVRNGGMKV